MINVKPYSHVFSSIQIKANYQLYNKLGHTVNEQDVEFDIWGLVKNV